VKLVLALVIGLALVIPSASALPPGPSRIVMTAHRETVERTSSGSTTSTYGLYAAGYKGRIGTEVLACGERHRWKICLAFIRTPRGTLTAQGLVPLSSRFLVLGVLGGTGIYSNAGGSLTITMQDSERTQSINGELQGF
jgi:hypothetical protein